MCVCVGGGVVGDEWRWCAVMGMLLGGCCWRRGCMKVGLAASCWPGRLGGGAA